MDSLLCSNEEMADSFKRFLETNHLTIVRIGSCQCGKSVECDQLLAKVNSLQQTHNAKEKEFGEQKEKLLTELLSVKEANQKASDAVIDKENQIKRLETLLLKEKTDNEEKTQQIADIKKTLEVENTNMEKKIAELQNQVEKEQEILEGKITSFTGFLELLVKEVKFQPDEKTDIISSTDLQRLLNYIQEIIKTSENDRLGLQHMRKGIEAAVGATNSGTILESLQNSQENRTTLPQSSTYTCATKTPDIPAGQHPIKRKEHERDISFKYEGFRCTCGNIVKWERSLLLHIRKCTEPWKHNCEVCKLKFFYKSELKRHFNNSAKCAPQEKCGDKNNSSRRSSTSNPNSVQTPRQRSISSDQRRQRNNANEQNRIGLRSNLSSEHCVRSKTYSSRRNTQIHNQRYNNYHHSQRQPVIQNFRGRSSRHHETRRRYHSTNNTSIDNGSSRSKPINSKENFHNGQGFSRRTHSTTRTSMEDSTSNLDPRTSAT